jgi:hypothetical protein
LSASHAKVRSRYDKNTINLATQRKPKSSKDKCEERFVYLPFV